VTAEHPDVTRMREVEAAAVARGYREGDVNHLLQPLVGALRLRERDGEALAVKDFGYYVEALMGACDAERALLAAARRAGVLELILDVARASDGTPS
jgi:hypothetical protein